MGRHALLSLILGLSACLPQQQARPGGLADPSASTWVERGVRYETGKPTYDELFSQVHRLHAEVASADDDRRAARQGLALELGLLPTVPPAEVTRVLGERAAKLRRRGATLSASGTTARGTGDATSLAQALSTSLASEKAIHDSLERVPERAASVVAMIPALESSVDHDIDAGGRPEVRRELAAARRLLDRVRARARELAADSERYSADLVRAASDGGGASSSRPPAPAPRPAPAPTPTSKPAAPAPTTAPAPAPTPATPPAKPDDFNP